MIFSGFLYNVLSATILLLFFVSCAPNEQSIFKQVEDLEIKLNSTLNPNYINPITNLPEYGTVREFTIENNGLQYSEKLITVNYGEKVRITFKNTGGFHDLKIDEFGVDSTILTFGEKSVVEFIANKKGVFEYYCSIGDHREKGMVGKLVIN